MHVVPDDRLVGQRLDEIDVGDLEDLPGTRLADLREAGVGVRSGLRRVGQRHVVLHAQHLEVLDTGIDVEVAVRRLVEPEVAVEPLGPRRLLRQLRLHEEVERRGRRRLEVEALHRSDAVVGEVREEHRGHRRAVVVELLVVLPERPTAALVATDPGHLVDHAEVFVGARVVERLDRPGGPVGVRGVDRLDDGAVPGFGLEPLEVPLGPVPHGALVGARPVEPRIGRLAVGRGRQHCAAGVGAQRHAERSPEDQHDHRRRGDRHCEWRIGPAAADHQHHRPQQQGDADRREQVDAEVVEGEHPGVPEAVLRHEHERHPGDQGHRREPDARAHHHHDRQHHTDAGQHEEDLAGPHVGIVELHPVDLVGTERQKVAPHLGPVDDGALGITTGRVGDRAAHATQHTDDLQTRPALLGQLDAELLPSHVVEERAAAVERQVPPQGHEPAAEADRERPLERSHPGAQGHHEQRADQQEEDAGDHVAEHRQRDQHRRPGPMLAGTEPDGDRTEGEQGQGQRDRERELARHRRRDVAAVDVEQRLVHQERDGRDGAQLGPGATQRQRLQQVPDTGGEGDDAGDGDQLERDVVGQIDREQRHEQTRRPTDEAGEPRGHRAEPVGRRQREPDDEQRTGDAQERVRRDDADVEDHDHQRRDDHVEGVGGEPGVPVLGPARDPEVGQQLVTQVRGAPHVGAHVTAGGRCVAEHQLGVHDPEHVDATQPDDDRAEDLRDRREELLPFGLEFGDVVVVAELDVGLVVDELVELIDGSDDRCVVVQS